MASHTELAMLERRYRKAESLQERAYRKGLHETNPAEYQLLRLRAHLAYVEWDQSKRK